MAKSEFIVLVERALSMAQWQDAIDAQDFLVRLVLDPPPDVPDRLSAAGMLGVERVPYVIERREIARLRAISALPATFRFALATPSGGDLKSCAAGMVAVWSYGAAAGGAVFEPVDGRIISVAPVAMRQHLDTLLAASFDLDRAYATRYPEPADVDDGPVIAGATRID